MVTEPSILVVDDEVDSLKLIIKLLLECESDYKVIQANNADKAFEIACRKIPDLIISDWNMPGGSGIDLLKMLKKEDRTKHIPVIIATAYMLQKSDLKTALDEGAMDYLAKPFQAIELEARINSAIQLVRSHKINLKLKNDELQENALHLLKLNEFMESIPEKLKGLKKISPEALDELEDLEKEISFMIKKYNWNRFDTSFVNLHPLFYNNLLDRFPSLSPKELKLSALIFLGMKTKEIALLLSQETTSIKTARYRLRQKLQLTDKENLETFLGGL